MDYFINEGIANRGALQPYMNREKFRSNIVIIVYCLSGNKYTTLAGDDFSATVGDIVKALANAKGRKFTVNDEPTVKLYDVNRYQFLPQLNHRYSYYDGRILTMTAMTPHPTS